MRCSGDAAVEQLARRPRGPARSAPRARRAGGRARASTVRSLRSCLLRFICSSPTVRSPGACRRASIRFTPGRVPTRMPGAAAQAPHELDVGPQVERRRGAVGRRHQHAGAAACAAACGATPPLRRSSRSKTGTPAGNAAEERLVAVAVAADDLDLAAALDHVLGEVERGADRAAHVPRRPQHDDQSAARRPRAAARGRRAAARRARSRQAMRLTRREMGGHGTRWRSLQSARVPWKETINGVLTRATGYQLQRAGGPSPSRRRRSAPRVGQVRAGDRLVEAPVFVICTLRSGSTLLRVLLDSHSQIRSPHELHLRYVSVHFDQKWSERSMAELGLDTKARRVPAVGPAAAPRAGRQRQADHRRQDAQQRLHRRPPARVLARRALHLPAAPPGRDRALAPAVRGEHADGDEKNAV